MNLEEDDIICLEELLSDLKEHQWNSLLMHVYPFIGADIENLEHIVAKLKNTKCEDCGEEFKDN